MPAAVRAESPRRRELLERAYGYVLEHGLAELSLRPLAAAIGSSPRVLLFLFGSKAELVQALLRRARQDELAFLQSARAAKSDDGAHVSAELWRWLASEEHRALLKLWVEGYARSLVEPDGPWRDFAPRTVRDWLEVLAEMGPPRDEATPGGEAERTLLLAVLRGAFLDLLATGDVERTTAAVTRYLELAY